MTEGVSGAEIRRFLGAAAGSGSGPTVRRVSSLRDAAEDSVVFAAGRAAVELAVESEAGLVLVPAGLGDNGRLIAVAEPRQAFARVYDRWFRPVNAGEVHRSAVVEEGAVLGDGCRVDAGAFLGAAVRMGVGCWIGPKAVVLTGTLGDRVRVQAGAVLGSDGFGYVAMERGYLGFPQLGTLVVGDDVEIGAGTTIDRGALEATVIGRGTKIDNLVHIAHNCQIGEDVLIAAQVGIAGSSVVGDRAILGGQVGIGEHARVGAGVILGGSAGVLSHKRVEGDGIVFWGTPARPVREYLRDVARMRRG